MSGLITLAYLGSTVAIHTDWPCEWIILLWRKIPPQTAAESQKIAKVAESPRVRLRDRVRNRVSVRVKASYVHSSN